MITKHTFLINIHMLINEIEIPKLKSGETTDIYSIDKTNEEYVSTLVDTLQNKCNTYIQSCKETNNFLYRGFRELNESNKNQYVFVGKSHDDRLQIFSEYNNKKSYEQISQLICDINLKLMGFTALRSNSTFCNSNSIEVSIWGEPYVMFPVNGFTFSYSTVHTGVPAAYYHSDVFVESYRTLEKEIKKVTFDLDNLPKTITNNPDILANAREFVKENKLVHNDLNKAIKWCKDVWIRGTYIAIEFNWFKDHDIGNILLGNIQK